MRKEVTMFRQRKYLAFLVILGCLGFSAASHPIVVSVVDHAQDPPANKKKVVIRVVPKDQPLDPPPVPETPNNNPQQPSPTPSETPSNNTQPQNPTPQPSSPQPNGRGTPVPSLPTPAIRDGNSREGSTSDR